MGFLKRLGTQKRALSVRTCPKSQGGLDLLLDSNGLRQADLRLYDALRETIPIIDAAIGMSVRLCGGVSLKGDSPAANAALDRFVRSVRVGGTGRGLEAFLQVHLDSLLTYGNAVAEFIPTFDTDVCVLYNADVKGLELVERDGGMGADIRVRDGLESRDIRWPELVTHTALCPPAGRCTGVSILRGLPFVSGILYRVLETVGKNWDKAGNVRYAVTYNPGNDPLDKAYAKERAGAIAEEWSRAMDGASGGDFVAVGDVSIKVIGAESPIPDSTVPVRQMMEQIVSKMGVPPYILGLSWSSTERMSGEQADIFTSLLTAYRRTVTPAIEKLASLYLRFSGLPEGVTVEWEDINLRDQLSEAEAAYYLARAASYGKENTHDTNP